MDHDRSGLAHILLKSGSEESGANPWLSRPASIHARSNWEEEMFTRNALMTALSVMLLGSVASAVPVPFGPLTQSDSDFRISISGSTDGTVEQTVTLGGAGGARTSSGDTVLNFSFDLTATNPVLDAILTLSFTDLDLSPEVRNNIRITETAEVFVNGFLVQIFNGSFGQSGNFSADINLSSLNVPDLGAVTSLAVQLRFASMLALNPAITGTRSVMNTPEGVTVTLNGNYDQVIPEPGTIALLGAGAVGLIARRRRRTLGPTA